MKKLLFIFFTVTGIVMSSCGYRCTTSEPTNDTLEVADTLNIDTALCLD
jgi:hypothetical protein